MSEAEKRAQDEQAQDQPDDTQQARAEESAPQQKKPLLVMREEEKKPLLSEGAKKEIREWVVSIAFALIAVFLIRTFLFTVIRVDGHSMDNTLHDGERMIVTVLDMKLNGPQRGDVVILHYPNRTENFVKRVIGVPGDMIWLSGGKTYVNTEVVNEPYIDDPDLRSYGPYMVPENSYFVMGDNRNHSNDSRANEVGFIGRDMFVGKVRFVMWPFTSMRVIN